jgi:NodT family efflux transporter outer membrane factor (OMF) lipoprotein
MCNKRGLLYIGVLCTSLIFTACVPSLVRKTENKNTPTSYTNSQDTINSAKTKWKQFFTDSNLVGLIDTALKNNQELNIIQQEIVIAKNEVRARKGEYLPFVSIGAGSGVDKVGRYTRYGSVEKNLEISPGEKFPEPFSDFLLGANVSWEADIWKKLRNAKKSAMYRYLASTEGKNFMTTVLISEVANSYYELMALDNQLEILKRNIEIQQNALEIVKLQKTAAKVTELAVTKFEAEVFKNQSRQFEISQRIRETENRINFLVGRYPQSVLRNSETFTSLIPDTIYAGIPSQLLENRPDIRQAELELAAAKLDVKAAKANFYPSLRITAGVGYQAFNPGFFINPESMLYYLGGELVTPLVNRNAIKAYYYSANARQIQAVYNYERTILTAYIEVANQISNISNLEKSYDLKTKQVEALTESITISNNLFKSARADYMEVLMTQRDALESKFELIETKKQQMNAMVNVYQTLGGGWY